MDDDRYNAIKKGIENKKEQTEKEYELNKLKIKEKEEESKDKFIFFSNKIFEVIFPNINLFEEYKKSEYFQNFHNSDSVIKIIKKSIINFSYDDLVRFSKNEFVLAKESEKVIINIIKNNYTSFYKNFLISQKAKALKYIGEIKNKFEELYKEQEFDISKFAEKIIDLKFKKNEINEIEDIAKQIFLKKMKEIINKELEYCY